MQGGALQGGVTWRQSNELTLRKEQEVKGTECVKALS